ncbi:MAG TPA: hypothetical protein VGH27_32140 [Streptosporangiaceae bacterium]
METRVIVLNGGSSSGKTGIIRCLQTVLPDPWLTFGTDTLIEAMPAALERTPGGIEIAADGQVTGPVFRALEAAWIEGIVAMARAGAGIIVDEAFAGGAASPRRDSGCGRVRLAVLGPAPPGPGAAPAPGTC